MEANQYLALIGDVVDSRGRGRWGETQILLRDALRELSGCPPVAGALAAPLGMTAGDEVQALFRSPELAVDVIQELTDRFLGKEGFPFLVFGLGYGALAEGSPPPSDVPTTAWLDGPCFHRARAALADARRNRCWVRCSVGGGARESALNALFELAGSIRSQWTKRQAARVLAMRSAASQGELAESFGVSPSVISETLKAARYRAILTGEQAVRELLSELGPLKKPTEPG